ncbi:hypothetical protein, partial [Klebsiella pneumoniae]|uniref:hypothetical protein n=1 Tax=Klebsiella pneumoniae TaxID=573 RepID=UPI00210EC154
GVDQRRLPTVNHLPRELQEHNGAEGDLEADYQAASDHLNLVQTALRQQEKIERYEADLDELQIRLEEQNEVVAEAVDRQEENEALRLTCCKRCRC